MKFKWLFKGDYFKLWGSTFFSQFSTVLFFYSLIWWSISDENNLIDGGIAIGAGAAASLLMSPIAGWLADRYHRGKLLAAVDAIIFVLFLFLYIAHSFAGLEQSWIVLLCRIFISVGVGSTHAASRSLIPEMVPDEHLDKAIGFQETVDQASQLATPVIAGIFVYFFGVDGIWLICAILTAFSAVLEIFIKDPVDKSKDTKLNANNLLTGFRWIRDNQPLKYLLYGTVAQQLLFSGFTIYIAVWSTYALLNAEWISGMMQAMWAIGSLLGALMVVFIIKSNNIKKPSVLSTVFLGVIIAPLGFVENVSIGFLMLLLAGLMSGILNIYLEAHLQRQTNASTRGRELSAFFAINNSLMPLGYVLAGVLSEFVRIQLLFLVVVLPIPLVAWFIYRSFSEAEKIGKSVSRTLNS